jgi:predicted Rossmann fold nucleotide-binding protein DprA/Smf involved in DNA uptake
MIEAGKTLNDDGAVLLMLCSHVGIGNGDEPDAAPLTLGEWNTLARKISDSEIKYPRGLLGMSGLHISQRLDISANEADRLAQLLNRGGNIALELEQLNAAGIWCVTRADELYPARIRNTLKHQAPPVLFGVGNSIILDRPAIGIVGSRNIDETGANFARRLGELCTRSSVAVVSGGARGTDRIAMQGALDAGGCSVGILSDSLTRTIRQPDVRSFIAEGRLILLTPYRPDNGFSIGAAMGRNKIIYGASDFSVVVSSEVKKGGTWAGAVEALNAGWCPLFVRSGKNVGSGNEELISRGGHEFSDSSLEEVDDVLGWMKQSVVRKPEQEVLAFA